MVLLYYCLNLRKFNQELLFPYLIKEEPLRKNCIRQTINVDELLKTLSFRIRNHTTVMTVDIKA